MGSARRWGNPLLCSTLLTKCGQIFALLVGSAFLTSESAFSLALQPPSWFVRPQSIHRAHDVAPPVPSTLSRGFLKFWMMVVLVVFNHSAVSDSFASPWTARFLCLWEFPGKNTGVGCHILLQGFFPTQGSNPHLLHWQVGSLPLSHLENHLGRMKYYFCQKQKF